MTRQEFTEATKRLIADRAGHQCSFPTCNRQTTTAGPDTASRSSIGVAAHIYSAAPGGPRGQGGLSEDELRQPENGIWLCSDHSRVVDGNDGRPFTPETLLSYKALQEARLQREVQGLYSPIGWVHELTFSQGPVFNTGQSVTLAKLNLFYGDNGTGKTALADWIHGLFTLDRLDRWSNAQQLPLSYRVTYLNPMPNEIGVELSDSAVHFSLNGDAIPFVPPLMKVFRLGDIRRPRDDNDLEWISRVLGVPHNIVLNLVDEIHAFPHAHITNLRWKETEGQLRLLLDCDGTPPGLSLGALSGREKERVMIEFVTAAARVSGRHFPTLLILDGCPLILFEGLFDFYSHHLLDPDNQFQTIMCIPTQNLNLDAVTWKGWEVVRFNQSPEGVQLSQALRQDDLGSN